MVAPQETGDLVRSIVRVPGSGRDSTLEPKYLNLSNVSSAAAAVFVPSTLPSALAHPSSQNQSPATTAIESNASGESKPSSSSTKKTASNKKRTLKQETAVAESNSTSLPARAMNVTPPPSKRPRVVYMTPEQVLSHWRRTMPTPAASGSLFGSSSLTAQKQSNFASSRIASTSVSQLLQERDVLREENRVLQQQLLLFQQLMTNRERLASVVRRLGVNVPQS